MHPYASSHLKDSKEKMVVQIEKCSYIDNLVTLNLDIDILKWCSIGCQILNIKSQGFFENPYYKKNLPVYHHVVNYRDYELHSFNINDPKILPLI